MAAEIDFKQEKKWTIIFSHIDNEKMEAWVQNVGMTESMLKKEFKMAKTNGFEKEISCNELKTMLNYVVTNCMVEAVLEIENHYNTDQKTINELKRNIENRLKAKGYTIVEHCFSSGEIDVEPGGVYEARAYLKLLNDRCDERKQEVAVLKAEKRKLENETDSLKHDKTVMQKEFDELCTRYKNGKDFLNGVDEDIAKYKDKIYLLDEEKNSLFIEIEEKKIELEGLNKKIKEAKHISLADASSLSNIKEQIKKKEVELNDLNTKIEVASGKYNSIKNSLEKYLKLGRKL